MLFELTPHPDTPDRDLDEIVVDVVRTGPSGLTLTYFSGGPGSDMIITPSERPPGRADELWKHTCYELFVRLADGQGYLEFNFSPSGEWAAYQFDDYRSGMALAEEVVVGPFDQDFAGHGHTLTVEVDLGEPTAFDRPLQIAVSAIMESLGGLKTYWALAHAPGKPDFHHPDAFAATLEPA